MTTDSTSHSATHAGTGAPFVTSTGTPCYSLDRGTIGSYSDEYLRIMSAAIAEELDRRGSLHCDHSVRMSDGGCAHCGRTDDGYEEPEVNDSADEGTQDGILRWEAHPLMGGGTRYLPADAPELAGMAIVKVASSVRLYLPGSVDHRFTGPDALKHAKREAQDYARRVWGTSASPSLPFSSCPDELTTRMYGETICRHCGESSTLHDPVTGACRTMDDKVLVAIVARAGRVTLQHRESGRRHDVQSFQDGTFKVKSHGGHWRKPDAAAGTSASEYVADMCRIGWRIV